MAEYGFTCLTYLLCLTKMNLLAVSMTLDKTTRHTV
jgi:hypothetical protein